MKKFSLWRASVGRKMIVALSGLLLVGFVCVHLAGNLLLFAPDPSWFNHYAASLEKWGWVLRVAEILLALFFLIHIVSALRVRWEGHKAKGGRYRVFASKKGPSRYSIFSEGMALSGLVLLAFLILHVVQFRFGPSIAEGYVTQLDGEKVRDLYLLVWQVFHEPLFVVVYVGAMLFLGFHLRHGFWSAFQSLGLLFPSCDRFFYLLGKVLAVLLAVGFLGIPLWFYFDLPTVFYGF